MRHDSRIIVVKARVTVNIIYDLTLQAGRGEDDELVDSAGLEVTARRGPTQLQGLGGECHTGWS